MNILSNEKNTNETKRLFVRYQEPSDNNQDKARHQLHEHTVEPQIDGEHVVGRNPRILSSRDRENIVNSSHLIFN